jgi:hypothetical protein
MPPMKRFARRPVFVTLRVVVVLALAGCSNQQRTSANPFMQPDRVPPPATRTIAPGTAQPYYPGDPVPAAQAAAPAAAAVAQMPAPPAVNAPVAAVAPAPATTTSAPQPLAFSNERSVSIPTDSEDLRFAVPEQQAAPMQFAPAQVAAGPTASQFAAAPQSAVIPAAYTPPASQPQPAAGPVPAASENTDGNPWRSPQIAGANTGVMQAQYVQPQSMQPTVLAAQPSAAAPSGATQQMPVELRPVAAPTSPTMMTPATGSSNLQPMPTQMQAAPQSGSAPPRMRFPSWSDPTTWFTPQPESAPAASQQLVGYMVPGPNGTQQMISVEQYQAMYGGGVQPTMSTANADGFRARGTATK